MAPSEVEVWRVDSPSRPCAYCRQDVETDPATLCPRCNAVYHSDCWLSNLGKCAIYGCEPAPKPPAIPVRPVRPVLEPPELPRTGANWAWLAPVFVIAALSFVRLGTGGSSPRQYRPLPFPPEVLRHLDKPLEVEALTDSREPVISASPEDVPGLIEEAQALEDSSTPLFEVPAGRLTSDIRALLRENVVADLAALKRADRLYRRCDGSDAAARVAEKIRLKRRMLIDLWAVKGPD